MEQHVGAWRARQSSGAGVPDQLKFCEPEIQRHGGVTQDMKASVTAVRLGIMWRACACGPQQDCYGRHPCILLSTRTQLRAQGCNCDQYTAVSSMDERSDLSAHMANGSHGQPSLEFGPVRTYRVNWRSAFRAA